jgi:FkbM family methyltransferase
MVQINHINNIVIHPVGLGDRHLKKPFYKPPDWNLGTGSFVAEFKSDNSYGGDLEIQTGDDALEQAKVLSVALIKMDIEGYEKLALRGLRRTLWKHRPIVEFEMTTDPESPVSIKSREELVDLFPENFAFLTFGDKSNPATGTYVLQPIEESIRFELKKQYDLVAYPIEKKIPRAGPPK